MVWDIKAMHNGHVLKSWEKEFPGIVWQKQFMFIQPPNDVPFFWWTEIPSDRLKKGRKGLFRVRDVSPWEWTRRYYGRYGLGRGVIRYEDRAWHWNDPLGYPKAIELNCSMRMEGDWNVQTPGEYAFSIQVGNIYWFYLDGKKVLAHEHLEPGSKRTYKTTLTAGKHHVEVLNAVIDYDHMPMVMVLPPGGSTEVPLDDYVISTAPDAPHGVLKSAVVGQMKP